MTRLEADWAESNEPIIEFSLPSDPLPELIRDYFIRKYQGNISQSDAIWLGSLIGDFLSQETNLIPRTRYAQFQIMAERLIQILVAIDEAMNKAINQSRARASLPVRKWQEVTLALGLPSACRNGLNQAEIGRQHHLTKMAISKAVRHLAAACGLEPAFGLGYGSKSFRNLQH
jgi:hypothetical protein